MKRVLVVDDNPVDRKLVGGLLEKTSDISVETAADGQEALQQVDQSEPDLVITDLSMPVMDGLQLVDVLRSEHPRVPVVLMTSKGSEDTAVQALRKGAASYVPKRLLAEDLVETVRNVLSVSTEEKNLSRLMNCMAENRCRFVLGTDRSLLSSLVGYLQKLVTQVGLCDESDCMRLGIALEEALVNALHHGNLEVSSDVREQDFDTFHALLRERTEQPPYCDRRIFVEAEITTSRARFVIEDQGPGFDPQSLPDPTEPANLEKVSGRGVLLMRTFMDSIEYNDSGNRVEMIKHGNHARPDRN